MKESILDEIRRERDRQDEQYGGASHDDMHTIFDWVALITKHTGRAALDLPTDSRFRYQMVRVGALAVAAIEWFDRRLKDGS